MVYKAHAFTIANKQNNILRNAREYFRFKRSTISFSVSIKRDDSRHYCIGTLLLLYYKNIIIY